MLKTFFKGCLLSGVILISACSEKGSDAPPSTSTTSELVSNLTNVSSSFAPKSLESSTNSTSQKVTTQSTNGIGFGLLQAGLIRESVSIGKDVVTLFQKLVTQLEPVMEEIEDGSSGETTDEETGNIISWNKTDQSHWSLLVKNSSQQTITSIYIDGNDYSLKHNGNIDDDLSEGGEIEASVSYTNLNTWSVTTYLVNETCDPQDVGAPSRIKIIMEKSSSVWKGKLLTYIPRWKNPTLNTEPTCNTAAGSSDISLYTDFVANGTAAKNAIYLIPTDATNITLGSSSLSSSTSTIEDYGIPNMVENFSLGSSTEFDSLQNNMCMKAQPFTVTWNSSCATNTGVSSVGFIDESLWVDPADFKMYNITYPSSAL